ncbi:hypothetical protein, partial [Neobacillus mesonae]|uniref:hypothetical protein n=1 Tax=Neobacillus mesonae TaxID=1193713 RepID=UPI00203B1CE7
MNTEVQVMPQQADITNKEERIIRRPFFVRPFFGRPPFFLRPPLFWRPYFGNPFLAGLLGGVLGGLLVSTLVGPYRYVYWYPYSRYPYYPLALHAIKIFPYFQKIVFTHNKKTPIVEVVDLVLFPLTNKSS